MLLSDLIELLAGHLYDVGDGMVILDLEDCEGTIRFEELEMEVEGRDSRLRYGDEVVRLTPRGVSNYP